MLDAKDKVVIDDLHNIQKRWRWMRTINRNKRCVKRNHGGGK